MTNAVSSLRYLIARTTVNRLKAQTLRLKRPRYLFFLLFGVAYFWFFFLRGFRAGGGKAAMVMGSGMIGLGGVLIAVSILVMWLFGKTSGSLAFQPAEVQLLFPAPLTRRQLIAYRVVRSQLVVLLNAFIWMFLAARFGSTAPPMQRFAAAWGLFSVLGLHPLGLALVGVQPITALRRSILWGFKALSVAILIGGGMLVRKLMVMSSEGADGMLTTVANLSNEAPAKYLLAPFRALIAPFIATDLATFGTAFGVVVGIIVLHLIWVLNMNVSFEEVAATASTKLATARERMRAFQSGGAAITPTSKTARSWLPLAPTGHPAMAIVWKNTLALVRTRMLFSLLLPVIAVAVVAKISASHSDADGAEAMAPFFIFIVMLFMMGPRVLRNDLRQDLLSLTSLKTYPLSGQTMVAAQLISPSLFLTTMQTLLGILAVVSAPAGALEKLTPVVAIMMFVLVPLVLFALNAVNLAIQNGTVLLFPSWVRLGPTAGGIEAMGQNLIMTFGSIFALGLSTVVPGVVGVLTYWAISRGLDSINHMALFIGCASGLLILVVELWLMILWFGRVFEKTEATAIGVGG